MAQHEERSQPEESAGGGAHTGTSAENEGLTLRSVGGGPGEANGTLLDIGRLSKVRTPAGVKEGTTRTEGWGRGGADRFFNFSLHRARKLGPGTADMADVLYQECPSRQTALS